MPDEKSFADELSENWDAQVEAEAIVGGEDKPADKAEAKGDNDSWKESLSESWDEIVAKDDEPGGSEFDEIFGGHKEALKANGMTPASYARATIAFNRMCAENPYWHPNAMESYKRGEIAHSPFEQVHRISELNHFAKSHPDVMDAEMQTAMVSELQRNPPKQGENIGASIKRAYDTVKAARERKDERKKMSQWAAAIDETAEQIGFK